MSSLDGSDTNFNPLTLDGEPIATSSTDVIGLISANALLLNCSNVPLTGLLTVDHNPSISVNGGTYLHGTYINGNASISGDVSVVGNVYVSNNVVTFGNLDGHNVYGDYLEVGADETSLGVLIYNKMSINGPIILGKDISVANNVIAKNVSVSGLVRTHEISANTYYNVPTFTGNLNNRISINGSAYIEGNLSVSGITYLYQPLSVNGYGLFNGNISTSSNSQVDGSLTVNTSVLVPQNTGFSAYPKRVGDNITGSKLYQGDSILTLDENWASGRITRISVNTFLQTISVGVSVSSTSTFTGISVNNILTGSSSTINATNVNSSNVTITTSTANNTNPYDNTTSYLLFRNPSTGLLRTGACRLWYGDSISASWKGGYWLYNAFYRTSTSTDVMVNISATSYTSSVGLGSLYCDIYTPGGTYLANRTMSKFFNLTYNHEYIVFHFCLVNGNFASNTGYFHMYIYGGGTQITDYNDTLSYNALCIG